MAEFLAAVLDAHVEGVLLDIRNLADVAFDGVPPRMRRVYYEDEDEL